MLFGYHIFRTPNQEPWQSYRTMLVVESMSPKVMRLREVVKASLWKGKRPGEDAKGQPAGWKVWAVPC